MKTALAIAVAAIAATACSTTEVKKADAAPAPAAPSSTAPASPRASAVAPSAVAANPLKDPANILSKRSVYFGFDDSTVRAEDQKLLQAHGKHLADNRALKLRIEGHCDERGSREYNLALGQRRAQSAKNVLKVLGVDDGRVETTSYGEDKPADPGHDEAAWARNRRADLKYPGE